MGIEEIREQLRQAKEAIQRLNEEKKRAEKKCKDGEKCMAKVKELKRKLEENLSNFEESLSQRTEGIPGEFGTFYREIIQEELSNGKIRDILPEMDDALSLFKSIILDLDDTIADLVRRISEKNNLFRQLKEKLEAMGEAVDEFIDWLI